MPNTTRWRSARSWTSPAWRCDGSPADVEGLLRQLAPQVLGALMRRYSQFGDCEDAVQEALLAASVQWPEQGVPENPSGWLITVASRRLTDEFRGDSARRRREAAAAALMPPEALRAPSPDEDQPSDQDDTLTLLFLCCHPVLSPTSQIALTLRAVGGLTTAQIARAFLVPEATMAQRISRAKASIKSAGARFGMPPNDERAERLSVVLHVLYLIFNEGYTASAGPDLQRAELTTEAIRLGRDLHRLLPDDGEVAGLLALMLLTDARRSARTLPDGNLVPLAEQDRARWNDEFDPRGRGPRHRYAVAGADRSVSASGCDRCRSRRSRSRRGDRLATDRRPVRDACGPCAKPDGDAERGGRRCDGTRPAGGPRSAGNPGLGRANGRQPPARGSPRAISWSWPAITLPHTRATEPQPVGPRVFPNGATSRPGQPG